MKKKKKINELDDILLYNDHKLPTTRRDFLASGLIGMSTLVLPTSYLMMTDSAFANAQACFTEGICGMPFLCFDGGGGMNIPGGNVLVGFEPNESQVQYGNFVAGEFYRLGLRDGLHPRESSNRVEDFGLIFSRSSGIYRGLNDVLAPVAEGEEDLRESVDGIILCTRTGDDSSDNPINTAYVAQRAGAIGKLVQLVGNANNDTGGKSHAPKDYIDLSIKPAPIASFAAGRGLLSMGDGLMGDNLLAASSNDGLGTSRVKKFLASIKRLSDTRGIQKEGRGLASVQQVGSKVSKAQALFDKFGPDSLDPRTGIGSIQVGENTINDRDAIRQAFDLGMAGDVDSLSGSDLRVASVSNLVLNGIAGAGTISIGGCDYHNGTAGTGDRKDYEVGRTIGRAIKMAAAKQQDLFVHLFTDGGVVGNSQGAEDPAAADDVNLVDRVVWTSDSGTRSAAVCLVYLHGAKRSQNRNSDLDGDQVLTSDMNKGSFLLGSRKSDNTFRTRQVGFFNKGGGINSGSSSIGNNVNDIWKGIILNYLAVTSEESDDEAVIADTILRFNTRFPGESLPDDARDLIRLRDIRKKSA